MVTMDDELNTGVCFTLADEVEEDNYYVPCDTCDPDENIHEIRNGAQVAVDDVVAVNVLCRKKLIVICYI